MAANGGKRKGAGRKKGSCTKKTREIANRAIKEGITPLEVMLKAMRAECERVAGLPLHDQDWSKACGYAVSAAPYIHPRLASVAHTGKDGGAIEVTEVSSLDIARRYAFVLHKAEQEKRVIDHESGEESRLN